MSVERDLRANELFDHLLDEPAEVRERQLPRLCDGDDELERLVRVLLAGADGDTNHGLRQAVEGADAAEEALEVEKACSRSESLAAGDRVGPFEVREEIGRGGMADVYLATRIEGGFVQRVALKVLARGSLNTVIAERFAQERDILGRLEHHHIAGIVDGGTLADGRPYFALEYVDGSPIDQHCSGQRLSVAERTRLMVTVCRTVHFAHRSLVVHRDLKPSNIFVSAEGAIKLLDFGIAKVLAGDPLGLHQQVDETRTVVRLMTPSYASPEQVRGEPVTTASDVYQLGLLLYQLISGQPAQRFKSGAWSEIEEGVCERLPEKPSLVAKRRSFERVPEDLERIVLMALRKEPARRYASADQMAEDLERFLAGQPIRARADTWSYRTVRFVRRNKVATASTGLLFLLLMTAIVALLDQSRTLAAERDRARSEARKAEQVSNFMIDIFQQARPSVHGGHVPDALELLEIGSKEIESQLADEPELLAMMLIRLSTVELAVGRQARGEAMAQRALELLRTLREIPPVLEAQAQLALGSSLAGRRDLSAALSHLQTAKEISLRELGEDDALTHRSMASLARAHRYNGNLDTAESLIRRALAWRLRAGPSIDLWTYHHELGLIRLGTGDLDGSEESFLKGLSAHEEFRGKNDPRAGTILTSLAMVRERRGDYQGAKEILTKSLELMRMNFPNEDQPSLITNRHNSARLEYRMGNLEAAEAIGREALAARNRVQGESHPLTLLTAFNLALVLRDQGRVTEASLSFSEIHDLETRERGEDRWLAVLTAILAGLAELDRAEMGNSADAAVLERARVFAAVGIGKKWEHQIIPRGRLLQARVAAVEGRWDEALAEFEAASMAASRDAVASFIDDEIQARWALALSSSGQVEQARERSAGLASTLADSTPRLRRLAERLLSELPP